MYTWESQVAAFDKTFYGKLLGKVFRKPIQIQYMQQRIPTPQPPPLETPRDLGISKGRPCILAWKKWVEQLLQLVMSRQ